MELKKSPIFIEATVVVLLAPASMENSAIDEPYDADTIFVPSKGLASVTTLFIKIRYYVKYCHYNYIMELRKMSMLFGDVTQIYIIVTVQFVIFVRSDLELKTR